MRSFAGCLALLLAWIPAAAGAQEAVDPGGVATVVVQIDVPDGEAGDSVGLTVRMAKGFDLYAPPTSTRPVNGSAIRIPLAFGVAADVEAGAVEAGQVIADWEGGGQTIVPFSISVKTRFRLDFYLGREVVTGRPGAQVEVNYYVRNRGNAPDSVEIVVPPPTGWDVKAFPEHVVLAAGDTAAGKIRLLPRQTAAPGSETVVLVEARGRESHQQAQVRHVSVTEARWFGDLASIPSTVFIGSTTGNRMGTIALEAEGQVRADTRIGLRLRHAGEAFNSPALRDGLTGPNFRLAVDHREWHLTVGDVFTRSGPFVGPSVHAVGLDARWSQADRGLALTVGRPSSRFGQEEGHLFRGTGHIEGMGGRWGVAVSDLRQDALLFEGFGLRSAGVSYDRGARDEGLFAIQAGLLQVRSDSSGSSTGPVVEAQYQRTADTYSVTARVRRVPATVPRTAALGDELLLSGSAALAGDLTGIGWGYLTRSPLLGIDDPGYNSAIATGLRYGLEWATTQLQLTAHVRKSERPYLGRASERRTLRTTVDALAGPLTLQLHGEWGQTETTDSATRTDPYEAARAAVSWSSGPTWGWAGLSYQNIGPNASSVYLDMGGRIPIAGAEVEGGLNARFDRPFDEAVSFWTGASFPVGRATGVTLGVDYTPVIGRESWRISVGLSRQFTLPLPLPRQPAVQGIVFEDRDGDRVRDPGEPGLPDVSVQLGVLSTRTNRRGEFRFDDAVEGSLQVDTRSLPLGLMVPPTVHLPQRGSVAIPVVRTGTVRLDLFVDRNGDGTRGPAEEPADGVVVSLIATDGRTRDAVANKDGQIRLGAVSPGGYTLMIYPTTTRGSADAPIERAITVEPGDNLTLTIPVPLRRREIRMQDDQLTERP